MTDSKLEIHTGPDFLKTLRKMTMLGQAAFARECGMPMNTYAELERGIREIRMVHVNAAKWAVVDYLGFSVFESVRGLRVTPEPKAGRAARSKGLTQA